MMAESRALRRLLQIRELEEEQSRQALESALGELLRMKSALKATIEQDRRGRMLVEASALSSDLSDRITGLEETRAAGRHAGALIPRIAEAELDVIDMRKQFMLKRVERRQVETLIEETEALGAIEAGRRDQQTLDDWYRSRMHKVDPEAARTEREETGRVPPKEKSAVLGT